MSLQRKVLVFVVMGSPLGEGEEKEKEMETLGAASTRRDRWACSSGVGRAWGCFGRARGFLGRLDFSRPPSEWHRPYFASS
ncbi:unnamed protein product [Ilex paraguariensis]|uniref:Secreted protein n=1 Tax=Ilex paraguariensis TaxID=185542 RepID=A0ABC8USP6_9AQUA